MKMTSQGLLPLAAACVVCAWATLAPAQGYSALGPGGMLGDGQTSIVYDAGTGEVSLDAPAGVGLTSINIGSAEAVFTMDAAMELGGDFDIDQDDNLFKATFGSEFGSLSFGNVAQTGLSQDFVLNDFSVDGSLATGGGLGDVDLVYIPEPGSVCLMGFGIAGVVGFTLRRRRGR